MILLSTYIILLIVVFILQRQMIYFPERHSSEQHRQLLTELNLKPWPSNQDRRAVISADTLPEAKGTVIVFHGNAGSAIHRSYYIDALKRLGYRTIIAEYPGYGERSGKPSETELIDDGLETVELAYQMYQEPIYLIGESLGSGVVSGIIAANKVAIKGLLLITPFDSLANVANRYYWFFLAKWLILDRFNNCKNLKHYAGNIAVVLAGQDEVIPNASTLAFYKQLTGNKKMWRFEQSGHNTLPLEPNNNWWREALDFIAES